jgi:hypothetical protein
MADPLKVRVRRSLAWSFGPLINEAGQPLDMSGNIANAEWFVLTRRGDATSIVLHLTKTLGNVLIEPTGTNLNGDVLYNVTVILQDTDTEEVPPGLYFHEPVVVDASGNTYTLETDDNNLIQLEPAVAIM